MKQRDPVKTDLPRKVSWWRRWFRRIFLGALMVLLVLIIFHRPILRYAITKIVEQQATGQDLQLAWLLKGTITSDIDISAVKISGGGEHWLPKGEIGQLSADYSLWRLLRQGPGDFLESVKLHDAEVELDLRKLPKSESQPTPESPKSGPPELVWPKSVDVKNANVRVTLEDGSRWVVEHLTLQTGEGQPGLFSCRSIRHAPDGLEFSDLKAGVEIRDRRLAITHFQLPNALIVEKFAADLSRFTKGEIKLDAALRSGAATANLTAQAAALGTEQPTVDSRLDFTGLTHQQIPGLPVPLQFGPAAGSLVVQGSVMRPRALKGSVTAKVPGIAWEKIRTDSTALDVVFENGDLRASLNLSRGPNTVTANVGAVMPETWADAAALPWKATAEAAVPALAEWIGEEIPVEMRISLSASASGAGGAFEKADAKLDLRDVRHAEGFLPTVTVEASATSREAVLKELLIPLGASNRIRVMGSMGLAESQPFTAQWKIDCESLATALQTVQRSDLPLDGALAFNGEIRGHVENLKSGVWQSLTGALDLDTKALTYKGHKLEGIKVAASMAEEQIKLASTTVRINAANELQASGQLGLNDDLPLQAQLSVNLASLADLTPWGELADVEVPVQGGSLQVDLTTDGAAKELKLSGQGSIVARNVMIKGAPNPVSLTAGLAGNGNAVQITAAEAVMGDFVVTLAGEASARQARLDRFVLRDAGRTLLEGRATVPFAAVSETPPSGNTDPLDASFQCREVDMARYSHGKFAGKADMDLKLGGTVGNPEVKLKMALREAKAVAAPPEMEKAAADLAVTLVNGNLAMVSEIRQAPLEPLRLTAQAQVDAAALRKNPQQVWDLPIQASVNLPKSDLAGVVKFTEGLVQSIAGDLRLQADITGTPRKPKWQGQLMVNAGDVAFVSPSLPGIRDGKVVVDFKETTVTPSVSAILAGGTVNATGTVDLAEISEPVLNLNISATEALVLRSRDASLRANAAVRMQGPLPSVRVSGLIEAVRGRIFKEIEFIPLSLPDDLPPPPPSVHRSRPMQLTGFLADWNFDLALRTRDPIRLMGNVLNGGVTADLKLQGTGAAPNLTGKAVFDEASLSLPFSRMKIIKGEAVVDPAKPMEPEISIQAESQVGEYSVTLYVYGSAFDPKTRFLSVPPLSEPDIAVLLATGAPLASNSSQAGTETAGRAAFMLLQDAYRKMFKKSGPRYEEPPRMHLSFNPSSGPLGIHGPAILADYELTRNWRLSGSAAQSGNMRAMLQWLVRFGEPAEPPAISPSPKR